MENIEELAPRLRDPAFFLSPSFTQLLHHLRNESPVHWTQAWPDRGFWSVTRYRDIRDVLLNPTVFSSQAYGSLMPADPHMYDTPQAKADAAFGLIPTYTDPPRHDAVRRPFVKPFSPASIAKLEQTCQAVCDELIDQMLPKGECDFVADVAGVLPMHIICVMLGVPREDWEYVGKYVNSFVCNTEPEFQLGATPAETIQIAQRKQFEYVKKLVEERRARPRDDLTTLATFAEVDGKPIDPEETFWWCWAFLVAGFETSRNVLAGGLLALIENPDQMRKLRENPDGIKDAAEELSRWASPSPQVMRVALQDTVIGEHPIKKGDWVVLWLASANRDERMFPDPYKLNISRRPNPHFAFSYGTHVCIGRNVSLLEVRHLTQTTLRRLGSIELAGMPEWTASTMAMGVKKLPIRYQAA